MSRITGIVFFHGGNTIPAGSIWCQGQEVAQATYPDLYAVIGSLWANTNGAANPAIGNFRLPPNKTADGYGMYPGAATNSIPGTYIASDNASHSHGGSTGNQNVGHTHTMQYFYRTVYYLGTDTSIFTSAGTHNYTVTSTSAGAHTHTITLANKGSAIFRPNSVAAKFCIWI